MLATVGHKKGEFFSKRKCKKIRVRVYEAVGVQFHDITWKCERQN